MRGMASPAAVPYDRALLLRPGKPRVYRGRQLDQIAFPLGGIGTGSISLGGWGQLRDFEIFNRPAKGLVFDFTFFTLHARKAGADPVTRVVQGPVGGDNFTEGGFGISRATGAGLPHFRSVEFIGAFPFARLNFDDPRMPLKVSLEAFNPFIPLNPDDSGLPAAIFHFHLTNTTDRPVVVNLAANLQNRAGHPETCGGLIEYFEGRFVSGLRMSTTRHKPDSPRYGTLCLATPHRDLNVQTHWYRGAWFDNLQRFWDQISAGSLEENRAPAAIDKGMDIGSIGLRATIPPGASVRLPVWITWHNPNFEKYWGNEQPKPVWKNYYATIHADAQAVAEYIGEHHDRLESQTRQFAESLFASTLPDEVLDAVSSQISILKTTTCIRLPDGSFWAWEGCSNSGGCCEGTCTHVWNYAQAMPFLFPSLERTIRERDYEVNLHPSGHMTFRMPLPPGTRPQPKFHAAADGQMGGIMKVYREWQICGDDGWLRKLWPSVKKALQYAWQYWDCDRDGVMEGVQHNTYDIEFYGPNTMIGSFYLGALRAAEEMARHLGDNEAAAEYRRLFESGRDKIDRTLFNNEYYVQEVRLDAGKQASHGAEVSIGGQGIDPANPKYPKYQYGDGCLSDQLIGQWLARIVRLGDLLDPHHVRSALASVFKYNWRADLSEHANAQRIYAVNEEAGLLLATWPRGGRPAFPFPYSDEVWCGIEYQVASHLIYEGLIDEGLTIVKGARDRYTGVRRNPWNEFECGHHYARSMASYALLLALADFSYSAPRRSFGFAPRIWQDNFACFFCVEGAWGMLRQTARSAAVIVRYGRLVLKELRIGIAPSKIQASLAGRAIPAQCNALAEGALIEFAAPVEIAAGQTLEVASAD